MVKETLDAVREEEQVASMIQKEALKASETIILKANTDAQAFIASLKEEAFLKSKNEMEKAIAQGEEMKKNAEEEANKIIASIDAYAKSAEAKAIEVILLDIVKEHY